MWYGNWESSDLSRELIETKQNLVSVFIIELSDRSTFLSNLQIFDRLIEDHLRVPLSSFSGDLYGDPEWLDALFYFLCVCVLWAFAAFSYLLKLPFVWPLRSTNCSPSNSVSNQRATWPAGLKNEASAKNCISSSGQKWVRSTDAHVKFCSRNKHV